jgi:predicted Fe-Mo cluster-binding NifX family protein
MRPDADSSSKAGCVAVAVAEGEDLQAAVSPQFGRASRFLLFREGPEGAIELLDNPNVAAAHGAGPATASLLVRQGVRAVLAGRFGPRAQDVLRAADIATVVVPPEITVAQALERVRASTQDGVA